MKIIDVPISYTEKSDNGRKLMVEYYPNDLDWDVSQISMEGNLRVEKLGASALVTLALTTYHSSISMLILTSCIFILLYYNSSIYDLSTFITRAHVDEYR